MILQNKLNNSKARADVIKMDCGVVVVAIHAWLFTPEELEPYTNILQYPTAEAYEKVWKEVKNDSR